MAPLSLRFRRGVNTTVFLLVEPHDSFSRLKARLAGCMAVKNADDVHIWLAGRVSRDGSPEEFADPALVSDFSFTDDTVLHVTVGGEAPPQPPAT